jgi:L-threonylcarbamoyladenylate synthase
MDSNFDRAVEVLKKGGAIVYPTETLYGLGCTAMNPEACARVAEIKNRPERKPLPLVLGNMDQLQLVASDISDEILRLADLFWPGPLSILVPARSRLAPLVADSRGMTSVRVTPHPVAASLCSETGGPLVSTSANISGRNPAARAGDLDPELLRQVDAAITGPPGPYGGPPSSVVESLGGAELLLLREGAVAAETLETSGYQVRRP